MSHPTFQDLQELLGAELNAVESGEGMGKLYLFERGDFFHSGEPDRTLSDAYSLQEWQMLVKRPGFLPLWTQGRHPSVEACLEELGKGITVTSLEELRTVATSATRGMRCGITISEDLYGGFMDLLCLGEGRWHGLLYSEFDPEERIFEDPAELEACYLQALEHQRGQG